MDKMDETELVKCAAKGDSEAFSILIDTHYLSIYQIAFKWCGNKEDAEDVAQDVCVKIGRSLHNFKMNCKFSTWVYRITVNTANDLLRKRKHINTAYSADQKPELVIDTADNPEQHYQLRQLWQKVANLPENQRNAIILVYGEEKSHAETAFIMACKESTVSWYIHEAKKTLKDIYNRDR